LFNLGLTSDADLCKVSAFRDELLSVTKEVLPKLKSTWWMKKTEVELTSFIDKIWSFGPSRAHANILFSCLEDYERPSIWKG
jgi:hypothetical protein